VDAAGIQFQSVLIDKQANLKAARKESSEPLSYLCHYANGFRLVTELIVD
jgi:hypothetical protein